MRYARRLFKSVVADEDDMYADEEYMPVPVAAGRAEMYLTLSTDMRYLSITRNLINQKGRKRKRSGTMRAAWRRRDVTNVCPCNN